MRTLAFLCVLMISGPAHAGGVAVLSTVLEDNGDQDGFPDTRETVQLKLLVQNTSGGPLNGLTLGLASVGPGGACITDGSLFVGSLATGEVRLTAEAFTLVVSDLDRTGLGLDSFDAFAQSLKLSAPSHPALAVHPAEIALDLDLNVSGGGAPAFFLESFEDGLGAFEVENLDAGLTSLAAADGYRCQAYDPDLPNDINETQLPGDPQSGEFCYPGVNPVHADNVFWGLSGPAFSPLGGRGFSGFHSLYFGIDLGPPEHFTTPLSVLEAVRNVEPIHLGWEDVSPTLTLKQQVSFPDTRTFTGIPPGSSFDRGVVMAQVADSAGAPSGVWIKLYPSINVYDAEAGTNVFGCMFDPTDDGNDEDDYFNPFAPGLRHGPSSTCRGLSGPANYSFIGETSEPFDAQNVGDADGPGLQGMWGIGTWIESSFDLTRFRGRSIRLRFLTSAFRYGTSETWENVYGGSFSLNPDPGDDGWWIDDVTVSGAVTSPAAVTNDDADNGDLPILADGDSDGVYDACDNCALAGNLAQADADADGTGDACDSCPGEAFIVDHDLDTLCGSDNCPFAFNLDQANGDGDGSGTACDCDDADATTYHDAAEVNDGQDNQCAGDAGFGSTDEISGTAGFFTAGNDNLFSWPAQTGATRYQVARSSAPDFTVGCASTLVNLPSFNDTTPVPPGGIRFYLVRARLPNAGSWGANSAGQERTVPCAI